MVFVISVVSVIFATPAVGPLVCGSLSCLRRSRDSRRSHEKTGLQNIGLAKPWFRSTRYMVDVLDREICCYYYYYYYFLFGGGEREESGEAAGGWFKVKIGGGGFSEQEARGGEGKAPGGYLCGEGGGGYIYFFRGRNSH